MVYSLQEYLWKLDKYFNISKEQHTVILAISHDDLNVNDMDWPGTETL